MLTIANKKFGKIKQEIEEHIKYIFKSQDINIQEIVNYSVDGGKRLRPLIFIFAMKFLGKDYKKYLDIALSIELIHNAGLICDDLPSVDNDNFRRGKLSVHKKYGEGVSVLVANWLLEYALRLIVKSKNISSRFKVSLVAEFQKWTQLMLEGQIKELLLRRSSFIPDNKDLIKIYFEKTASLFLLSTKSAAILGKARSEEIQLLDIYGKNLGIAYQLIDDLYEYRNNLVKKKEYNYAQLFGENKTQETIKKLIKPIIKKLNTYKKRSTYLKTLLHMVYDFSE